MINRIAVVLHHHDEGFSSMQYVIKFLIAEWERWGVKVELLRGIERRASADLVIPHLDATITPPEYTEYFRSFPLVINQNLTDITKRRVSRQIVTRDSDYDGAVIVKTNYNACGNSERSANPLRSLIKRMTPQALRKPLKHSIPWRFLRSLDEYPIFAAIDDVPPGIFDNPHLVVERFMPEMEGGHYLLRNWLFFGDHGVNTVGRSNVPIVKAATMFDTQEAPLPEGLATMRREMQADYGKFDYVLQDGRVVLYDVNRTPTFQGTSPSPMALRAASRMAQGLLSLSSAT